MKYDVVIAGGSIAGLFCAREIAKNGHDVLVIEEDYEIGTPEHCGGLVSLSALQELGIVPGRKTFEHQIDQAKIFFPNGKNILINSKNQKVIEIDRREFDKQIAHQAKENGAEIKVKVSFFEFKNNVVKTSEGNIECKLFVDARGVSSLIQKDREGVLSSAQYEVFADWISNGKVEIYFDQVKYPGFFAWVIPISEGVGKIGVAGMGINASDTIKSFLSEKPKCTVIRKIFAPIWIKGPIKKFVTDNTIVVGDAAGQSKPTTAGGIFSCGIGGILAGKAISEFLKTNKRECLEEYQKIWMNKFGKEFDKQLLARKLLQRIDNKTINKLFDSITPEILDDVSEKDDFDFHTSSIIKLLGMKRSIDIAQTILGGEIKKLLTR